MADPVLDQRLDRHHGQHYAGDVRVHVDRHVQPASKTRSLETQVALDVRKLLAERHVRAMNAEPDSVNSAKSLSNSRPSYGRAWISPATAASAL